MTRAKWGLGGDSNTFVTTRSRRGESGASVVEFALVVPLLLMFVFGVIEFGTVMAQKATVASAAREAARYGSVNLYAAATGAPHTCAEVVAVARQNATSVAMNGAGLAVEVRRGSDPTSAATMCSAPADAGASGAYAGTPPCKGAATTDTLYVEASFSSDLNIPFVMSQPLSLETTGAARCEYE